MAQSADRGAATLAKFNAAHNSLVARLRELPPDVAELTPGTDVWSAAQVGWHVALANEWMADVLFGSAPMARPAPAGFKEIFNARVVPAKIKAPRTLEPPAGVARDSALERLRASSQRLSKAIASLTPQRGAGYCITLPFGTLSLFEFAEFAAGHVLRHVEQVERTLARA